MGNTSSTLQNPSPLSIHQNNQKQPSTLQQEHSIPDPGTETGTGIGANSPSDPPPPPLTSPEILTASRAHMPPIPPICFHWYHKGACHPKPKIVFNHGRREHRPRQCNYTHSFEAGTNEVAMPGYIRLHDGNCGLVLCPFRRGRGDEGGNGNGNADGDGKGETRVKQDVDIESPLQVPGVSVPSTSMRNEHGYFMHRTPITTLTALKEAGERGENGEEMRKARGNMGKRWNKLNRSVCKRQKQQQQRYRGHNAESSDGRKKTYSSEKRDPNSASGRYRSKDMTGCVKKDASLHAINSSDDKQTVKWDLRSQKRLESTATPVVLVDYKLPEGDERAEWDTDYLRQAFGEIIFYDESRVE